MGELTLLDKLNKEVTELKKTVGSLQEYARYDGENINLIFKTQEVFSTNLDIIVKRLDMVERHVIDLLKLVKTTPQQPVKKKRFFFF